jgi:hypothetical protein
MGCWAQTNFTGGNRVHIRLLPGVVLDEATGIFRAAQFRISGD